MGNNIQRCWRLIRIGPIVGGESIKQTNSFRVFKPGRISFVHCPERVDLWKVEK